MYFVYNSQVYASYDSWILTFNFDVSNYIAFLSLLGENVETFHSSIKDRPLSTAKNINTMQFHRNINALMEKEYLQFRTEYTRILRLYNDLVTVVTNTKSKRKQKRAILPLGGILSQLFGVADEADINNLRRNVNLLRKSQEKVLHVLDDSLTILNATTENVRVNRKAINRLANATNWLNKALDKLYLKIHQELEPEIDYVALLSQIHTMYHVVSSTLRMTHENLMELSNQVAGVLQGSISPSLVPPKTSRNVLVQVRNRVSKTLDLPYSLSKRGLRKYYQNLQTTLVADIKSFHLVTVLPLIHKSSLFMMYKVVNVPVPQNNTELVMNINVQFDYMAMSQDRNNYMLLTEKDVMLCKNDEMVFCKLNQPTYSTGLAPS